MFTTRRVALVVAALLAASVAVGCAGDDSQDGGGGDGGEGAVRAAVTQEAADQNMTGGGGGGSTASGSAVRLPEVGPSVIKTGSLEIGVPKSDVEETIRRAVEIAGRLGGFVASTSIDSDAAHAGTLVIRVPATRFEDAVADLEGLGNVRHESITGEDVSQTFVDLEARLRNWQSQEAVLLRLMDRARTVTDTIRVQGELSRVQLEIERLRGRLGYLEDQTAMGTITATFTGAGPAPGKPSTLGRAWERALDAALGVLSAVIVGAGVVIPVALLLGLALLVFRGLRPRLTS